MSPIKIVINAPNTIQGSEAISISALPIQPVTFTIIYIMENPIISPEK